MREMSCNQKCYQYDGEQGYKDNTGEFTMANSANCTSRCSFFDSFDNKRKIVLCKYKEEPMFKVGDRVKLITDCYRDSEYNPIWGLSQGKIAGTVELRVDAFNIEEYPYNVKWDNGEANNYRKKDLELIKEEPMKYEEIKKATLNKIVNAGACSESVYVLMRILGKRRIFPDEHILLDTLIQIAEEMGEVQWLIDKGFIREKKEEVFYKVGNRFKRDNSINEYMLSQVDEDMCCLICINGSGKGNRYMNPIEVNYPNKITEAELCIMSGISNFIKIED